MELEDIKTGMLVETRDGVIKLVLSNTFIGKDGGYSSHWYNSDLTHTGSSDIDIVKVYAEPNGTLNSRIDYWSKNNYAELLARTKLLWSREKESVEMTIPEIEQALGITNLKITKDK